MRIREDRQARLTSDEPPTLFAVMHEAAIRTVVGGVEVMQEQLERLIVVDQQPTVSIRVLPFGAGAHPAMGVSFTLLTLPDPSGGEVCAMDGLSTEQYMDRPPEVERYSRLFDRMSLAATKTIAEAAGEVPWMK